MLIAGVVAASTRNKAEDAINDTIVSRSEDGVKLIDEEQNGEKDELEEQFNKELISKYKNALSEGNIFLYEMVLNSDNLHDYRFIRSFTAEELDGATFSSDYSRIIIQGETHT
ncbi:MAG: hypothetical protein IJM53_01435 [Lachnospiraceae bacterium]|nr:hypothetical protein [Lachnospiraceae bacterium]